MVTTNSKNIFFQIKDEEKKNLLIHDICRGCKKLIIKSTATGGDIFLVEPVSLLRNQLSCRLPEVSKSKVKTFSTIIVYFELGTDKYLALCDCQTSNGSICLDMNTDVFRLQRREHFRLRLPISYKAFLNLEKINGVYSNQAISILDMSAGGCCLEIKKNQILFKKNDLLQGKVQLSRRNEIPIFAIVKHVSKNTTRVGIQFKSLSNMSKDRLAGIIMDLYKELFSSLKKK